MKQYLWMSCALAVMMLAVSPALAQKGGGATTESTGTVKGDKGDDGLAAMQAAMIKECALSEAQTTKLNDRVKAYKEALADWQKENGEKLATALKAGKGDTEAREQAATLLEAKNKLEADMKKDIEAILTAEQKAKWDTYLLYTEVCRGYSRANLTEAQKTKIHDLVAATAKEMDGTSEKEMRRIIHDDLAGKIDALLTAEQKEAMAKKKVAPTEPAGDKQPKDGGKGK